MRKITLFLLFAACLVVGVSAQNSNIVKRDLTAADIDRIIKKVAANEGDFRQALTNYVFNRNASISIIGLGGQIAGNYTRNSLLTLTAEGVRSERIIYAPVATTPPGFVSPEDLEDLGGVNPFAIEPSAVPQYNFTYIGVEKVDELDLYVFEVTPKVVPDPKKSKLRLFTGRIWVDTEDLMIVKSRGKAVPETKVNKFPVVETIREQVDGKYWFPSDARSDDELVFDNGSVVKLRVRVKFSGYKLGRSEVRILDDVPDPTPSPTPKKPE
ncbi:MAG: hypothetical protein WKF34_00840 [Pyrinomonadaceae bacterium]